ncbi:sigma factor, partial [Planctomycetota bacterium]
MTRPGVTNRKTGATANPEADEARLLMLAFQRGEDDAFDQLVNMCQRDVFALASRSGLPLAEAEDLAQEVFLRVYRSRRTYRPEARF